MSKGDEVSQSPCVRESEKHTSGALARIQSWNLLYVSGLTPTDTTSLMERGGTAAMRACFSLSNHRVSLGVSCGTQTRSESKDNNDKH